MAYALDFQHVVMGTANFGQHYAGKFLEKKTVERLLFKARELGIVEIDTAEGYGCAEIRLGEIGVSDFKITTKFAASLSHLEQSQLNRVCDNALKKLRIESLETLIIHNTAEFIRNEENFIRLHENLVNLRKAGKIRKIGISIYEPDDLAKIPKSCDFDLVQFTHSPFDNRWSTRDFSSGGFRKIEKQARSIFLRGLLLNEEPVNVANSTACFNLLTQWRQWLKKHENPALVAVCLVLQREYVDKVVLGFDSEKNLNDLMQNNSACVSPPEELISEVSPLLNPRIW